MSLIHIWICVMTHALLNTLSQISVGGNLMVSMICKVIIICIAIFISRGPIGENIELAGENTEELKVIYVNKDVSTHFIAMEDIKYVDISVNDCLLYTSLSLNVKIL